MRGIFLNLMNAGFYGSIVIVAVLLLRQMLKKAPKSAICLLWLLALVRLVLPFQIESRFSLQPDVAPLSQLQEEQPVEELPDERSAVPEEVQPHPGQIPAVPDREELPGDVEIEYNDQAVTDHRQVVVDYVAVLAWIWAAGTAALWIGSAVSWRKLKQQVENARYQSDGWWEVSGIGTAFVLGLRNPRIYLPAGLSGEEQGLILAHERTHIARRDHWFKPVAYLVLTLHWYNPLVWLAYACLCRDIEMACDEQVVKDMDVGRRKAYSHALLTCAAPRMAVTACPVAFGEVPVKGRILNVLNYRKPGFWITLAAVAATIVVTVCFLTSPVEEAETSPLDAKTAVEIAAERDMIIALEYKAQINGSIRICKADGAALAEVLEDVAWQSWLISKRHDFEGYVDLGLYEDYSLRIYDNGHADVISGEDVKHYRIPSKVYEQVMALLESANEADVIAAKSEYLMDWGITLSAENVTRDGMTLVCRQNGILQPGELMTGSPFRLEKQVGGIWQEVPKLQDAIFTMEGWLIEAGGSYRWDVDWSWLYGSLTPGNYRIGKDVSLTQKPGDSMNQSYYAEFTIGEEDPELALCRAALENVGKANAAHIVELHAFSGTNAPLGDLNRNYFRYGDTWLSIDNLDVDGPAAYYACLNIQGQRYEGEAGEDMAFHWEGMADSNLLTREPWLVTFDAAGAKMELISREETQEGCRIRVMIYEPYDSGYTRSESYYVDLNFNYSDILTGGILCLADSQMEETVTFLIPDLPGEDVKYSMEQYAGNLESVLPGEEELAEQCREAVIKLQKQEELYLYADGLLDASTATNVYMRAENGWLFRYQLPLQDYLPVTWLCVDGKQYIFSGDYDETGLMSVPYYWKTDGNTASHTFSLPEFMNWDWESLELVYQNTETENGQTGIVIRCPEKGTRFTFCFGTDGELSWISMDGSSRYYVRFPYDVSIEQYLAELAAEAAGAADQKPGKPDRAYYEELFTRKTDGHYTEEWVLDLFEAFYTDPGEFLIHLSRNYPERAEEILGFLRDNASYHAPARFRMVLDQLETADGVDQALVGLLRGEVLQETADYLRMCREALTRYQAQGSWCVKTDRTFSGPYRMNPTSTQFWYIDGEDFLLYSITPDDEGTACWYELCYGGTEYSRMTYTYHDTGVGQNHDSGWQRGNTYGEDIAAPWLVTLDWDGSEIEFLEASTDGDCTLVTFTVQGSPIVSESIHVEEYRVTFWLRGNNELWKVEMDYTQHYDVSYRGEQNPEYVYVHAEIDPAAASPEEAARMIETCHRDACLHIDAVERCTDPYCTDSTHDHYGIACTVEHCTNPTHHHGNEHHH